MYWMLYIWENGKWSPQFGDHELSVVRVEMRDSYGEYPRKHRRIEALSDTTNDGVMRRAKELTALSAPK